MSALGLARSMMVLWNTIDMEAILTQLRNEGFERKDEDVARFSPFGQDLINLLGRYLFALSDAVARAERRSLRRPNDG